MTVTGITHLTPTLQCEALQQENVSVVSELNDVRSAANHMHHMLDEGDARGAQLGMQLMAAQVFAVWEKICRPG